MKTVWIGLLVCSTALVAQTNAFQNPSASTKGNCSPALNGNNNQVSITCTGLSTKKANDLIKIMNQILARQLDLKQVDDQLAQLHSDVENLSKTIDPFSGVTKAQMDLWQKASDVISACNALGSQWNQMNSSDFRQGHMDEVAKLESEKYHATLHARTTSLRDDLLKELGRSQNEFGANYDQVDTLMQLSGVCQNLNSLRVEVYQKVSSDLRARRNAPSQ